MQRPELFSWPFSSTLASIVATGNGSCFIALVCIYQIEDNDYETFINLPLTGGQSLTVNINIYENRAARLQPKEKTLQHTHHFQVSSQAHAHPHLN